MLGSSLYFAYGEVRSLPGRARAAARYRWNDAADRFAVPREWEAPLPYQWRAVLRRSGDGFLGTHDADGPRVLFGTGYGFNPFVTALHSTLAVALRLRGGASELLVCDKSLPACDWNQYGNMDPHPGEFGPGLPRVLGLSRCRTCTR